VELGKMCDIYEIHAMLIPSNIWDKDTLSYFISLSIF